MKYNVFTNARKNNNWVSKKLLLATIAIIAIALAGLQAQNTTWSLPPNYADFSSSPPTIQPLPAPDFGLPTPFNYAGLPAQYSHNAMQDKDGNLLFFGVDHKFYDKDGYYLFDLWPTLGERLTGANELLIVPDPADCNSYYIFGDEPVSSAGSASVSPNYCKFDLTNIGPQGVVVNQLMDLVPHPYNTFNRSVHHNYGATKLRADGSRLIFLNIARRVYIFKIDNAGISYVKTIQTDFVASSEYINSRNELEVIELNTAQGLIYRVAFAYYSSSMDGWLIFNGDIDYNTLNFLPNTQEYILLDQLSTSIPDQAVPHGLEFSEDGNILYFTHVVNPLNPNPIEYHVIGSGNNVKQALNVNNATDFQYTQIETDIYNHINFVGEQNNVGNRIAELTNTNTPSPLNFTDNAVAITYNYALAGNGTTGHPSKKLYNLPDQIDGMDYTAHFTATPECCIAYTSFDVEEAKNNQEYTGTATWSPGAGSNPFGSASGTVTVRDLLVIKSGANITINNMRFEFDVNARLIVENGARLTINGTTLTVYNDCGGDALMWKGVEVWGTGTGTFQPAVAGRFTAQNSSVIEHALYGAVNYKRYASPSYANNGGIIQATTGTKFRNNFRDVEFNAYESKLNGNTLNDQSFFSDVTFITDASLNNPLYNNSIIHATLNEVTGITFSGCDFQNTDVSGTIYPYLNRGQGILTYNSKFTVNARCLTLTIPCTSFDESNFTNLTEGIVALNTVRTQVAFVNKSNFNNNFKSIFIFNMETAKITENDFDIGASVSPGNFSYGLYLWNCSGYTVENNDFTTTHNGYVGVYVNHSDTAANEIYRNNFSNLVVGSQAANTNGDNIGNGVGLEFRCNNYESIVDYDILISSGMVADDHGNCVTVTGPSNNDFSYTAQYGDFWAETSSVGVPTYRYSPPNGYNLEPRNTYYNPINTATHECVNLPAFNYNNSCPNRQGGGGIILLSTPLNTLEAAYDSINDLMSQSTKDTTVLKTLQQDLGRVKSQMQRTRSYIMQDLLLNSKNSDGKLEVIDFLKQHAAYNTNADEQLLTQLYIAIGNIGAAQSNMAQLQSKPNNQQFVEFSNIAIALKQHPKQSKALLADSLLLQQVKDLAHQPNENSAVAAARALLVNLGLATYEETIEVVIPTGSKARLANQENEASTTNNNSFVNVFPNPANDNLTISHNLETKDGTISLEIMDVMGRVLLNNTINNTNHQIDISQLASGLYFYNIIQQDKMIQSGKLVVE